MRLLLQLVFSLVLLSSFQCDESVNNLPVTPAQLEQKEQEILDYIASFSCVNATECKAIAFGAKPCGGPRSFLVYPNTVNQLTLKNLVAEYYQLDHQHNIQTGAISDCMVVMPPQTINCVSGKCEIGN